MIVHICSHPSVAPIVFRVKFNYLRLAFLSFQNPTQHIFSLTAYRYFSFHLKYLLPVFPACCTNFCLLDPFPLVSPVVSTASIVFFIKPTLVSLGFSHTPPWTATGCSSVYSISIQLNGKQSGISDCICQTWLSSSEPLVYCYI